MIDLKYRIDFVRLENEPMPDSENINDGSTCYIIDTAELYIYYKGTWYNSDIESGQSENNERNNEITEKSIVKNDEAIKNDGITKDEGSDLDDK